MKKKQLEILENISSNQKMNEYKDHALKNSDSESMFASLLQDLENSTKAVSKKTSAIEKFEIERSQLDEKVEVYRDARKLLKNSNAKLISD
jgi:chromosome segregation ATPase